MGCHSSSLTDRSATYQQDSDYLTSARSKLTKHGKELLKDFIGLHPGEETSDVVHNFVEDLLKEHSISDSVFINFDDLVELGTFPRFPLKTTKLDDLKEARNNALIIFISHHWLRCDPYAEDWNGIAHPDNVAGDKYRLCIEGIRKLRSIYAPRLQNCYVWMDYICVNQDNVDLSRSLGHFDKIIECCDCLFTPLVEVEHDWTYSINFNALDDYRAKSWNRGDSAYLSRGWARLEMHYAASIPLLQESTSPRQAKFDEGFAYLVAQNRRPHFVYSSKEHSEGRIPCIVPQLSRSFLTDYHPMNGHFTVESDMYAMPDFLADIQPYVDAKEAIFNANNSSFAKKVKYDEYGGYVGQTRGGKKHGHGTYQLFNGDAYEGKWRDDAKHGRGRLRCENGVVYEGEWAYDRKNGEGVQRYADGGKYDGTFENNERNGTGIHTYADGSLYMGEWKNDRRDGTGTYCFWSWEQEYREEGISSQEQAGNRMPIKVTYEGSWEADKKNGYGTISYPSGVVYSGVWKNDVLQDGVGAPQGTALGNEERFTE